MRNTLCRLELPNEAMPVTLGLEMQGFSVASVEPVLRVTNPLFVHIRSIILYEFIYDDRVEVQSHHEMH